ncbi:MAG: hypothetical protein ACE5EL_03675 [Anaerolineae bacterium]
MSASQRFVAFAVVASFAALAAAAAPRGSAATGSAPRQATATPIPEGPIPCNPEASRVIEPRVVEVGGEAEVTIRYDFTCTGEDRVVNFFLVVENTGLLGGPRRAALANVKEGLLRFVNAVNYLNGSKGGLTLYAEDYSNRVVLRGGNDGKEALLGAIGRISVEPIGNSAGAGPAIRDATERLPTGAKDSEVTNVLFVVDAGAPVTSRPLIDLDSACRAAHDAGVHVMVVGLENAGYRMAFCATNGWARWDPSPDARDFAKIADELAEMLVKGKRAGESEVFESLRSAVSLVPGSSSPKPPDNLFANDYSWTFPGVLPPGGQEVKYRIKAADNVANEIFSPSLVSEVTLYYNDQSTRSLTLDRPEICVHARGDPSFCSGFPPQPTATPSPTLDVTPTATVAATDTPSASPTVDRATNTPAPSATPRDTVPVFLPFAAQGADLGRP